MIGSQHTKKKQAQIMNIYLPTILSAFQFVSVCEKLSKGH